MKPPALRASKRLKVGQATFEASQISRQRPNVSTFAHMGDKRHTVRRQLRQVEAMHHYVAGLHVEHLSCTDTLVGAFSIYVNG
jgi:hypothetical protein